jgi:hypothetical protein
MSFFNVEGLGPWWTDPIKRVSPPLSEGAYLLPW